MGYVPAPPYKISGGFWAWAYQPNPSASIRSQKIFHSSRHQNLSEWGQEFETKLNSIKDLYRMKNNRNQIKVEMNQLFGDLSMNIVLKMVVGKRYSSFVDGENNEEVQRIQRLIVDFFKYIGVSVASDVLPSSLSGFDWDGQQRAMKKISKEMDVLAESWLQEHRKKRVSEKTTDGDQ
ncbi:cytochrome P450 CYP82D47-like [Macadamia integrifolia]|uniref:cytochrome P450 CYP82D47-like n=1 Tax=Macadamia integrifolia TaxID=60698 RepID=UPI001C4F6395|nr:cytochrome P450 CYP82D47-like [Macadamia integrifolia]